MTYNTNLHVDYHGIDGRSVRGFADMKQRLDRCARELTYQGMNHKLLAVGLRTIRDIISAHGLYAIADVYYSCGFNICCDKPGETEWLADYNIFIIVAKNKDSAPKVLRDYMPKYRMHITKQGFGGTIIDLKRRKIQHATESMCCEEWHNRIYQPLKAVEEPITDGVIRLIQSIRHEDELSRIRDAIDNQRRAMDNWRRDDCNKYIETQAKTRFDILAE